MNITRSAIGLVLVAGMVGVAGCGSGGEQAGEAPPAETSSAAAEPTTEEATPEETASEEPASEEPTEEAPAEEIVITIRDFKYEMPETVPAGAEITVINEDTAPHTVTSTETDDFDAVAAGGASATFTAPSEPGEYPFVCTFHANMTGTLVVSSDG